MNRLTRDQIIGRALDMVDSPVLDQKERPSGAILPSAMSIGWLQEGLDFFHTRFPFGATIQTTTLTWLTGQESYALPTTFIIDYQDGVVLGEDQGRLIRKGLDYLLSMSSSSSSKWGKPGFYAVVGGTLRVRPIPSQNWQGKTAILYYYSLPALLTSASTPKFPSDIVLTRYVYLRGLEWTRAVPPGTAEKYATDMVADLQRQGISVEAEASQVPFDRSAFPGSLSGDPNAWMGSTVG